MKKLLLYAGVFYFCNMIEVDYLIVGAGLAGIAFAETCLNNGKKIRVFDNNSQNSTLVAGGLYNPVVLKRFSEVWEAQKQLETALPFYQTIEKKVNQRLLFEIPLLRKFTSVEEQNNWFTASDHPSLVNYLNPTLETYSNEAIPAPYKYGKVNFTGYLDTATYKTMYLHYLKKIKVLEELAFEYDKIEWENNRLSYKNYKAKHIVFAEGFGLHKNPFFNNLPLDGTKGELLLIHAPELKLDKIINASIFILPIGNDRYKVGATYNWEDKTPLPTKDGLTELTESLKELINCSFTVEEHYAGIRPTVKNRRPLLGKHFEKENLFVLNGLGTRGVMFAPFLAQKLFNYIENNAALDKEIDILRIYRKMGIVKS